MPKIILLVFAALTVLSGCYDRFYGPKLRNEYLTTIELVVNYDDGSEINSSMLPCRSTFFGKKDSNINRIRVSAENRLVYDFGKEELQELYKKLGALNGRIVTVIDTNGVHFTENQECAL